jgi:hypothetical protein
MCDIYIYTVYIGDPITTGWGLGLCGTVDGGEEGDTEVGVEGWVGEGGDKLLRCERSIGVPHTQPHPLHTHTLPLSHCPLVPQQTRENDSSY